MSTVHLILQGKGGVGKSVIATLLVQYLLDKGLAVTCFDADPVNSTLASFSGLQVTKVDLIETTEKGRRINPRRFDDLVEKIASQPAQSHVIVDTGASAFVPLVHYMVSNDLADVLTKTGHELVIHSVVTGGQALLDTLNGASQLVAQLDSARFVIWLNPFWGPVSEDGKTFEQMKTYQDMKKRIEAVISLPTFNDELFPQDIASMLKGRLTFKDAIASPALTLMSRHRLKIAQRDFYSRLDTLAV